MFTRHKYADNKNKPWYSLKNPVVSRKFDGAHFFLNVDRDGSLRFFSKRESVKGGFPERTEKLPHLTDKKLPQYAGHTYSVELVHTGKHKDSNESHPNVSGVLLSLPPRAIQLQEETGPVRAVLLDVINPPLNTFSQKIIHMKQFEKDVGKPDVLFTPSWAVGQPAVVKAINDTKAKKQEGVIITELDAPEHSNPRIKLVHKQIVNLRIVGINQEFDKDGKPKPSTGSFTLADATGRIVGDCGTGLDADTRKHSWENPDEYLQTPMQVTFMSITKDGKLRHPVYNGLSDSSIDTIHPPTHTQ